MREYRSRQFLKPVQLRQVNPQITALIQNLRDNLKPSISNQASEATKQKFVSLVNDFQTENNFSIKKPRFLENLESEHLRTILQLLTKYHSETGCFTLELLNKGLDNVFKGNKTPITHNIELDLKRIMEYIDERIVAEYKKSLDLKLKKLRQEKNLLNIKLDIARYRPQLELFKAPKSTRPLMGISDRMKEVEDKFGRLSEVSGVLKQKQRILSSINSCLLR